MAEQKTTCSYEQAKSTIFKDFEKLMNDLY